MNTSIFCRRILRLVYDLMSDGYLVPRRILAVSEKLS
jgi:hypothetical protein